MAGSPKPFSRYEFMIAWRYIRARRAEGGVSVMTWISLIGITLAVFALVVTLAVRTGLRDEFIRTLLGANAHVELLYSVQVSETGARDSLIPDFDAVSERVMAVDGVLAAAPVVRGQVMANSPSKNVPLDVYGIRREDIENLDAIAGADSSFGDLSRFEEGIALGGNVAAELGVHVGDRIRIISANGVRTAMGTSPRRSTYEVVYIFSTGQYFIDRTRAYLPLAEAQKFFSKDNGVDQLDILVQTPDSVETLVPALMQAGGVRAYTWTWKDRARDSLRALSMQDNALFILLAILVLIASMNIVSGLIMLVKNKGRDIGILRTVGLDQSTVMRVFFIVGATIGTLGTVFGVLLGVLFSLNIDSVYAFVNWLSGNGVRDLELRGFYFPPATLTWGNVLSAVALSLGLSWLITLFPARRAARMNPVEALRYE